MSHSTDPLSPTDRLLRDADPVDAATLAALDTGEAATALRDAIVAQHADPAPGGRASTPAARARPRRRLAALALATTAIAIAVVLAVSDLASVPGRPSENPGAGVAWAAGAVRVAKAVPRLLPGEPGWRVTRADEMNVENGSTLLTKGNRAVEYNWYPRSLYASYFKDRQLGTQRFADVEIDGVRAALFRYDDGPYFAMWKLGDYFVEARAQYDIPEPWRSEGVPLDGPEAKEVPEFSTHFDLRSFRGFVTSLRGVDVETWLSAMPPSVVKPQDNAATVARMLDGVPLPGGFDRDALVEHDEAVRDRYQLGAKVSGAVLCSWFKAWRSADRAGDTAGAAAARQAVGTAPTWPVFELMGDEGAYPEMVASDAELFAAGRTPGANQSFEGFWGTQFCQ